MNIINVPDIIKNIRERATEVGCFDAEKIISAYSGGKDSTAVYLIANELFEGNFTPYMADTDNEHPYTVDYARTIHEKLAVLKFRSSKRFIPKNSLLQDVKTWKKCGDNHTRLEQVNVVEK